MTNGPSLWRCHAYLTSRSFDVGFGRIASQRPCHAKRGHDWDRPAHDFPDGIVPPTDSPAVAETRVDLAHLLEDLRDAYPGALEETILTEIVANALDSGARTVRLACEPAAAAFTALDDGSGMQRRELSRYHDIAASTKTRGQGIGFAGVGIKLGLLLCEEVVTETRRGATHVATRWHLASRHKAPWKWIPAPGRVAVRGTAVRLRLANPLSPLLDAGFVEAVLRRHFEPLLDGSFGSLLAERYPQGVRFEVNGRLLAGEEAPAAGESAPLEVRFARKRKPSAIGFLRRVPLPLDEDRRGVAIATLGKVIRRGWDWLGVTPAAPERITGLIEAPALAECLTLNKADFIRSGPRGAVYLGYRKAIQQAVAAQLAAWGDARDAAEHSRRRAARPVERDLERVLVELADDFPLLASIVERRTGGQRRLAIGSGPPGGRELVASAVLGAAEADAGASPEATREAGVAVAALEPPGPDVESAAEPADREPDAPANGGGTALPGSGGPKRPGRYGLAVQFESRPEGSELGRVEDSTVWVNEAHPAYRRAAASRSEGYHVALAVAMALAPLAVEPAEERAFVTAFLDHWGRVLDRPRRGARR